MKITITETDEPKTNHLYADRCKDVDIMNKAE